MGLESGAVCGHVEFGLATYAGSCEFRDTVFNLSAEENKY